MGEFLETEGEPAAEAALQTAAGVGIALERARGRRGGKETWPPTGSLAAQEARVCGLQSRDHLEGQPPQSLDPWWLASARPAGAHHPGCGAGDEQPSALWLPTCDP